MYHNRNEAREEKIVQNIIKHLNEVDGCYAEKRHGGVFQKTGNADITGCINGRRFEIEVKRPGEEPRPKQIAMLNKWSSVGAITGWATSMEEVRELFFNHGERV